MWKLPIFILLITTLFTFTHSWGHETHKKIQLKDVKVLTLHQGQMTRGRRVSPVPQLNCIGGDAKSYSNLHPHVVQCTNKGWDGQDYQWECKADMSDSVRFGMIHVSCEGYDYPDDEFVLAGSCGLNYNLAFTEAGRKRQQKSHSYNHYSSHHDDYSYQGSWFFSFFEAFSGLVPIFLILGVFLFILNCCTTDQSETDNRRPGHDFRDGGRGGHNPPPYGWKYQDTQQQQPPSYQQSQGNHGNNGGTGSWLPSFATGAGLGYLFGSSGTRRRGWGSRTYAHYPNNHYHDNYDGFGGRSRGGWTRNRSSSDNEGTSRQTSGFGGTSRR